MVNAAEPAAVPSEPEATARSHASLRHAAANVGVALMFFLALMPNAAHFGSSAANLIWLMGAGLMGVLSLIRVPPNAAMVTPKALAAVTGMLLTPALIKAQGPAMSGAVASAGMILELVGVALSQVARVYMGRRFGLLPANRGIVSTGPFRFVRHPIYVGWFILSLGFAMSYPSVRNFAMIALTLPFMMWRITLEEELLTADAEYRAYAERIRYRLIPGLY